MSSSFEKSVKGATKIKAAPPKTKYIEHILIATHSGEHGVAEVFRSLQNRLRDSTWTVVFKSLITVHLMIREGSPDVTLAYLANHRNMLAINSFSEFQTQGRNIRHYANYLAERARAYRDTKCDYVRGAEHRLEKLSVDKGLLRETEIAQHQITALLKCDVLDSEPENEITITVFRMLVLDLLAMFHVLNQALINILGHFFEMSKSDAERAMEIYRSFTKQTDFVVGYLSTARQYEHQTRVEVPKLKHAPVNLGKQLEDYLADPDFEINRRQYLAEQEAKKGRGGANGSSKPLTTSSFKNTSSRPATSQPTTQTSQATTAKPKGPDPDLIDFFDSIEQNQQPMAAFSAQPQQVNIPTFTGVPQYQQPQPFQQTGLPQQAAFQNPGQFQPSQFGNGFVQQQQQPQQQQHNGLHNQQLQPDFTGAGFGGYTPQPAFQPTALSPIQQDSAATFDNKNIQPFSTMSTGSQQSTNPFRQSVVASNTGSLPGSTFSSPPTTSPLSAQSTNPFAKPAPSQQPFSPPSEVQVPQYQQTGPSLQPSATGTNPFARNINPQPQQPQAGGQLIPQATGSTNPFRQSAFINTTTGSGWQNSQQPIGGGLDHLQTVPVFPRPAQQQPWQQ